MTRALLSADESVIIDALDNGWRRKLLKEFNGERR